MAWHVERFGTGGAPVVLLHSSGLSGRQWRRLAKLLEGEGFLVTVPDLTGHGGSPAWAEPEPFSYRVDVDLLVASLKEGPPTHVVGHSYGGLVGLLAALEVPDKILSLVLFEPVAMGTLDPVADADANAQLAGIERPWGASQESHDAWLAGFVDYWSGTGAWGALREEARAEFRRVGWVLQEGVKTLAKDATPASAYAALRFPVTLLTAERSPLAAGRVVAHLARSIPGANVLTLPNAGHMAPLTNQDQVNPLIQAALKRDSTYSML